MFAATLPRTARLKLIDVWFLFGFLTCFFVFLLHVVIEITGSTYASKGPKSFWKRERPTKVKRVGVAEMTELPEGEWKVDTDMIRDGDNKKYSVSNMIRLAARVFVPTFTFIFMVSYWISAIVRSNNI